MLVRSLSCNVLQSKVYSGELLRRSNSTEGYYYTFPIPTRPTHLDFKENRANHLFPKFRHIRSESSSDSSDGSRIRLEDTRSVSTVVEDYRNNLSRERRSGGTVTLIYGGDSGGNRGGVVTGGCGGGGSDDKSGIRDYYKEMLQVDPDNPLLLRNYGRFLHEVEGDVAAAEDCYGRAILSTPGDGDVLSLYGNLIWEAHKDEERADDYFQRAVQASPGDCHVLGSYAHFLWEVDDEKEEEEEEEEESSSVSSSPSPFSASTVVNGGVVVDRGVLI